MNILKQTFHWVIKAIVVIVLPCVVVLMITSKTGALFGLRSYVVMSGSMTPTLPVGSIVVDQKLAMYHTGDIITFVRGGQEVTHRIKIAQSDGSFIVQGDANKVADGQAVKPSDIKGKEFLTIPFVGRIIFYLRTLPGLLLFIILPSMALIAFEFWNLKHHIEVATEEKVRRKIAEEASHAA